MYAWDISPPASSPPPRDDSSMVALDTLPYDLLLTCAQYLDLSDVHSLHLTCKSLYAFSTSRPVYRRLAHELLRRCRPLPLQGFQRIHDLTTEDLIRAVNKAVRYERAWQHRAPRPITITPYTGLNPFCHYMDLPSNESSSGSWYKVVSSPPDEEVDWLSPITSSYTLCATKSGKVVCWDVRTDKVLATWSPGMKWELWKCRVEFDERMVYFTMAKLLSGSYDDERLMEFVLMQLYFPSDKADPVFNQVSTFRTAGVVMNIFLLDPSSRLLSAFVWVSNSNTIGLFALLDWDAPEYVFVDTGIECIMSSNWSCIVHDDNIVIHSEESSSAFQHFYPISLLRQHTQTLTSRDVAPAISARVPPARMITKQFIFPPTSNFVGQPPTQEEPPAVAPPAAPPTETPSQPGNPNPFPFPPWYPESAHFVRQWWPTVPGIPRLSCTVVLLASHDVDTHRTKFVLAQHYFRVPLTITPDNAPQDDNAINNCISGSAPSASDPAESEIDDAFMRLSYVSAPFEVVCVADPIEDEDDGTASDRPRPLCAVDFGHAVWIEFMNNDDDDRSRATDIDTKLLRFVTFPSPQADQRGCRTVGEVQTLEIPEELDLDSVETINIDQSQGAVILSVKEGKIFILCYD